jgi:hypothetical protein
MEFVATVHGNLYTFSFINSSSVLVSGNNTEYIVYKARLWNCADDIDENLLLRFGQVIEQHMKATPAVYHK